MFVCQHCQHKDQSMQCIECYVCQHCRHWYLWLLHNTIYRVIKCENSTLLCIWNLKSYVCYVCWHIWCKTHPHISAHNFLNIQPIFNPEKFWKAETEGFKTIPSILYMLILLIQDKGLSCIQCYLCQHCQCKALNSVMCSILCLMHSVLYMSKQSIHSLHNIHTCNGMHVDVVDTIKLQCRS